MARILYGVHGTGHGHAVRALTVARHYPEHEFLFVSHGEGAAALRPEFPLVECPNPETPVRSHRVAVGELARRDLHLWLRRGEVKQRIREVVERFQPEAAITDYEFFVPRACREAGIPCLSLDNQHVIIFCHNAVPLRHFPSLIATSFAIRFLFTQASHYVVTRFFRAPLKSGARAWIVPPLLRKEVQDLNASEGEHILAYQGYQTFPAFLPFLQDIQRPVMVYGLGQGGSKGNLQFKAPSEEEFAADLASCQYVVCGGGHTLISEALYLGKPLLVFPIRGAFEQLLNAHYVEKLGYGRSVSGFRRDPAIIREFEARLDAYRATIRGGRFLGNPEIYRLVDGFIRDGSLPDPPGQAVEATPQALR
jgi:uncharacterized protein (TIGR00661 family)